MRDTLSMQHVFGTVVWVVCGVAVLAGFAGLFFSRKAWDEYGKEHLVRDTDESRAPASGSPAAVRERDVEIRQLLDARNERRAPARRAADRRRSGTRAPDRATA